MGRRFAVLVLPLALACGPGADDDGPAVSAWAAEFAAVQCRLAHVECDCSDPQTSSEDQCIDAITSVLENASAEAEAAGLIYDADCAAEALAGAEEFGCGTWSELDGDCSKCTPNRVYHGDVAVGDACLTHGGFSDCEAGALCLYGVCVACGAEIEIPSLAAGQTCVDANYNPLGVCEEGLRCDLATAVCVQVPAIGESCPDGVCVIGAHCSLADPMVPVCIASPADGEPCPDGECAEHGSACKSEDQSPPICVPEAVVCQ
jgi:hypothetical protein